MNRATEILSRVSDPDAPAAAELLPLLYGELRGLAAGYMERERAGHTLQSTALIHEAYLKLIGTQNTFESRAHFLGVAARAMRQVLVDHARRQKADKRGGGLVRVTLSDAAARDVTLNDDLLALHEAIQRLAEKQARLASVVELRFFGGLTIGEAAAVLGVSHTTVEDDWSLARAWLARELANEP